MSDSLELLDNLLSKKESKLELADIRNTIRYPVITNIPEGRYSRYRRISQEEADRLPIKYQSSIRSGPRGGLLFLLQTEEEYQEQEKERNAKARQHLRGIWEKIKREGNEEGYSYQDMLELSKLGPEVYKTTLLSNEIPKWLTSENQYKNVLFNMYSKPVLKCAQEYPNVYDKIRVTDDPSEREGGDLRQKPALEAILAEQLFNYYGMSDEGPVGGDIKPKFVPCWMCGTRLHHVSVSYEEKKYEGEGKKKDLERKLQELARNALLNPEGYQKLQIDKLFTKKQAGDYQFEWVLPACQSCNQNRGQKSLFELESNELEEFQSPITGKRDEFQVFKKRINKDGHEELIPIFKQRWSERYDAKRKEVREGKYNKNRYRTDTPLYQKTPKYRAREIIRERRKQERGNMTPEEYARYIIQRNKKEAGSL